MRTGDAAALARDLTIAPLIAGFSAPFVRTGDAAALARDLTISTLIALLPERLGEVGACPIPDFFSGPAALR